MGTRSHQRPTQTQLPLPTDAQSREPRGAVGCQASPSTPRRLLNDSTLGQEDKTCYSLSLPTAW